MVAGTRTRIQLESQRGAGLAEYALLAVLIAILALVAVRSVGQEISKSLSDTAYRIKNADTVQ